MRSVSLPPKLNPNNNCAEGAAWQGRANTNTANSNVVRGATPRASNGFAHAMEATSGLCVWVGWRATLALRLPPQRANSLNLHANFRLGAPNPAYPNG